MSLICSETGDYIKYGTILWSGTHGNTDEFLALSQEAINRIPETEKNLTPCQPGDGGVNVHEASSTMNLNGSYSLFGFTQGKYCFSISKAVADKYLPNHLKNYS